MAAEEAEADGGGERLAAGLEAEGDVALGRGWEVEDGWRDECLFGLVPAVVALF